MENGIFSATDRFGRSMHVLILTEEPISFSGTMVRGGQIQVRNVVQGLRERGHDVHLVDWNPNPEKDFQHSISPQSRFVDGAIRTFYQAVKIGGQRDFDIILSKTRKTYLPGFFAAKILGIPHVVHVGSSLDRPTSGLIGSLDQYSFRGRLQAPHDGYFVVCSAIAEQLEARGISKIKTFDVKNGVNTDRFRPEEQSATLAEEFKQQLDAIPDDAFQLGYIGSIQALKGLSDLQQALAKSSANVHVIVGGDGPLRSDLEEKFGENGTFLGSVPYEQVPELYKEFDAFVLPSHTEGLPRVILEAQAAGTPVIASRVGGVPEIVEDGETGLLC
ncbi:MAG: glycosyltransferase family 4 protein, partial [Halobacteriaceae archaeon]